jgi:hypothetical protein
MVAGANPEGGATIVVSGSMIANNNAGWNVSGTGAEVRTLGNNQMVDNGPSVGTLTPRDLL